MEIEAKSVEILQAYADKLIALGDRCMSIDEEGERYLDTAKITTNKHKRRVLMMWIGEIISSVLDDLLESQNPDYNAERLIEATQGVRLLGPTDFSTISLSNVLIFEILDLLDDETDETDHSFS